MPGDTPNPQTGAPATPPAGTPPADDKQNPPTAASAAEPAQGAQPPKAGDTPASAPAAASDTAWGDDWRTKYAGDDEKMLKRLERYQSPKAALDALIAAQSKLSSGELKTALKPDATPEEVTQWRKENGVPETAEAYELRLTAGRVVGDADKPFVDSWLKSAHANNLTPAQASSLVDWYYDNQETAFEQQAGHDAQFRAQAEDTLRQEWGQDYRTNVKLANSLFDNAPAGVKENIMGARLADGSPLGNNPDALNWLVGMAREVNPVGTLLPSGTSDPIGGAEARMSELRTLMGDTKSIYWKGDKAEALQAEYRKLTTGVAKARGR